MSDLTYYHLPASPNCAKPRLALGIKRIACDFVEVPFDDRRQVLAVSKQPLVPVLKHGDAVIFDSGAIIRYLDANFPGAHLFADTREGIYAIERWERFGNERLGGMEGVVGLVGRQIMNGPNPQPALTKKANELLVTCASEVEETLATQDYLLGDAPNAADCTVAPWMAFGLLDADAMPAESPLRFFASQLSLPVRFTRTIAWVERMQALDAAPAAQVRA